MSRKVDDLWVSLSTDMERAIQYAVDITRRRVVGKIEMQGLAGFVQKIATALFLTKIRIESEMKFEIQDQDDEDLI